MNYCSNVYIHSNIYRNRHTRNATFLTRLTDYLSTTTMRPPTTKKPAASCYRNGTNFVIGSEIRGNNGCDKCICGYYGKDLFPTWTCSPAVQCLWFPSNCKNITTVGCCPTCAGIMQYKYAYVFI